MSQAKRRDTKPELAIRSGLHRAGLRFFVDRPRPRARPAPAGRHLPRERVAVFVDGRFWHFCPEHATVPKNNRQWWLQKLDANRTRDADTDRVLTEQGGRWCGWEHEIPSCGGSGSLDRHGDPQYP